jgi:polysaccharide pyruvyl transferase WcaK-like protein
MIFLHGNTRTKNFGDELLVDVFKIWSTTKDEEAQYVQQEGVSIGRSILKLAWKSVSKSAANSRNKFVFVGGGYFTAPSPIRTAWIYRNVVLYALPVIVFKILNPSGKVGIFGVGFGKLPKLYKLALEWGLKGVDTVYARDQESMPYAKEISGSAQLGADAITLLSKDPALSEYSKYNRKKDDKFYDVLIHISNHSYKGVDIFNEVVKFINLDSQRKIVFITDTAGAKYNEQDRILKKFQTEFPQADFLPYQNVQQLCETIGKSSLVITTKLHVGIVAASYQIPTLCIPCHPKIERFYKDISYCDRLYDFDSERSVGDFLALGACQNVKPEFPDSVLERATLQKQSFIKFLSE